MAVIENGKCGVCGTQIFSLIKHRNVPNGNYAEIVLALNNGTIARHGVCQTCAQSITSEQVDALTDRIKETWSTELVGTGTEKQFTDVEAIVTDAYGIDEAAVKAQIE